MSGKRNLEHLILGDLSKNLSKMFYKSELNDLALEKSLII